MAERWASESGGDFNRSMQTSGGPFWGIIPDLDRNGARGGIKPALQTVLLHGSPMHLRGDRLFGLIRTRCCEIPIHRIPRFRGDDIKIGQG